MLRQAAGISLVRRCCGCRQLSSRPHRRQCPSERGGLRHFGYGDDVCQTWVHVGGKRLCADLKGVGGVVVLPEGMTVISERRVDA